MARMHAAKKGQARSHKPVIKDVSFVTMTKAQIEKVVLELAKQDMKPSKIGLTLRDSYGVPSVKLVTGLTINQMLDKAKLTLAVPEDIDSLIKKATALKKHLENNRHDVHNKRGLILIESKIRRLAKYYKREGRLPSSWSYE